MARIEEIIKEYGVEEIVLGYPKNMDNSVGERGKATEEFRDRLEKRCGIPVVLWDERLTTMESERILMDGGIRRENRKSRIDWMAASLILQSYMDSLRNRNE